MFSRFVVTLLLVGAAGCFPAPRSEIGGDGGGLRSGSDGAFAGTGGTGAGTGGTGAGTGGASAGAGAGGGGGGGGVSSMTSSSLTVDHQPRYDFGTVIVGTRSAPVMLKVQNGGGGVTAALAPAALSGAGAAAFTVDDDGCAGKTLAPGATCTVAVLMAPSAAGSAEATVTVRATPGGTATVTVTGTAAAQGILQFMPGMQDFGSQAANSGSVDRTLTLANSGGSPSGPLSLALGGADAAQFSIIAGGTCTNGQALAAHDQCTVAVRFAPTTGGSKAATLIANASPGGPGVANLTGAGVTPAMLSFDMAVYSFGTVPVGSSTTLALRVMNTGTQDSGPLSAITAALDPALTTTTQGTCTSGRAVAGGTFCTIVVEFAPLFFGPKGGSISVSASPGGTAMASLIGVGQAMVTLTVNKTGSTAMGTVTSIPAGDINCDLADTKCSNAYTFSGTAPMVTLHATPMAPGVFGGWGTSCPSAGMGDCTVSLTVSRTITAVFAALYDLTLSFPGAGAGTAIIQPGSVTCTAPRPCTVTLPGGTFVSITATPVNTGARVSSLLTGWTGPCAALGPDHRCDFTLGEATSISARFDTLTANLAFVTATDIMANLGGGAAYDAQCNLTAAQAGINNATQDAYVAWIAATNHLPVSLLGASRGWVRMDLLPWIDDMATALSQGLVYYPVVYDETGRRTLSLTLSGMTQTGALAANCGDWSLLTGSAVYGVTHAGGRSWVSSPLGAQPCAMAAKVICLSKGASTPLPVPPTVGKRIFLSRTAWTPGGGLTAADLKCQTDKPAAVTTARAILVASTRALGSVLGATTTYVRPDGVRVGTGADIISALTSPVAPATLDGPVVQDGAGNYIGGDTTFIQGVWTGAPVLGTADKDTCRDWVSAVATDTGSVGAVASGWYQADHLASPTCNNVGSYFLQCAEQ